MMGGGGGNWEQGLASSEVGLGFSKLSRSYNQATTLRAFCPCRVWSVCSQTATTKARCFAMHRHLLCVWVITPWPHFPIFPNCFSHIGLPCL